MDSARSASPKKKEKKKEFLFVFLFFFFIYFSFALIDMSCLIHTLSSTGNPTQR